jgi:cellulose biosynthesis protein BcsQ
MSDLPELGQIISFYSYKGGVGRSMAVANVGAILSSWHKAAGKRVLLIDWDLEAPGLYAYLEAGPTNLRSAEGILDYFEALLKELDSSAGTYDRLREDRHNLEEIVPLNRYIVADVRDSLDLMTAGRHSPSYLKRVAEFDWAGFWDKYPAAVHAFRELVASRYTFVLIDSRTGYGDISGLCSSVLPEKLVIVFSPNRQHLDSVFDIVERSVIFRTRSDDIRPLAVFPLARVDIAELKERDTWLRRFEDDFEKCFRRIYSDQDCDLIRYFENIFVPHIPYFCYGEKLAMTVEESRAGSLRRAYEDFARLLTESDYPWQKTVSQV